MDLCAKIGIERYRLERCKAMLHMCIPKEKIESSGLDHAKTAGEIDRICRKLISEFV